MYTSDGGRVTVQRRHSGCGGQDVQLQHIFKSTGLQKKGSFLYHCGFSVTCFHFAEEMTSSDSLDFTLLVSSLTFYSLLLWRSNLSSWGVKLDMGNKQRPVLSLYVSVAIETFT